ncbi:hypothetical protein FOPE_11588 [Fonsecaea pedrosoi]|nr:hypothetical protein FOPE_11588 [Fonsecaea pedrosoi]
MATRKPLRPEFFVTRQNGAMVPLIAMDELPIHVQVEGVPRSLSAFDTAGMTGVGVRDARHEYYVIESMNNTKPIPWHPIRPCETPISNTSKVNSPVYAPLLRSTTLSTPTMSKAADIAGNEPISAPSNTASSSNVSTEEEIKSSQATTPPTSAATNVPPVTTTAPLTPLEWRSKAAPVLASNSTLANPESDMPPSGQKVYCSYWMRHGECNFAQQGCMYKHVMPLKLEVLEALGFRDLPDWYRKAYNVGSLRVNGGRNGLSYGILDGNKGVPAPPPAPPAPPVKRASLNAEATKRIIASHINGNTRAHRQQYGDRRPRPSAGPTAADIAKARAEERERRDVHLAAAFAADLDSDLDDMMDEEMERIREKEQAGWEEEQKAAREVALDVGHKGKGGEAESTKEVEKIVPAVVADAAIPAAAVPTGAPAPTPATTVPDAAPAVAPVAAVTDAGVADDAVTDAAPTIASATTPATTTATTVAAPAFVVPAVPVVAVPAAIPAPAPSTPTPASPAGGSSTVVEDGKRRGRGGGGKYTNRKKQQAKQRSILNWRPSNNNGL